MTFRVHFYAEQAFLSQTKSLLERSQSSEEAEASAMCILACSSAIESLSNSLLSKVIRLPDFDELRLTEKIEKILQFGGLGFSWADEPWMSVKRLINTRNWLAHFKDHDIGLVNGKFVWIPEEGRKPPVFDPYKDLTFKQARRFYDHSREALLILVQCAGADVEQFDYLRTEQYAPLLAG